jgi:PhnB protein
MTSRLNPYITLDGKAREALELYREVLGGELTLSTFGENGMGDDPAVADQIMHGQLETPSGYTLMVSDSPPGAPAQQNSGVQISLSGDASADAELSAYYDKLAAAGTVVEPLVTAPWGDKFGMVTDPFGILWMVNISGAQQG